jgi:hypothetical protein
MPSHGDRRDHVTPESIEISELYGVARSPVAVNSVSPFEVSTLKTLTEGPFVYTTNTKLVLAEEVSSVHEFRALITYAGLALAVLRKKPMLVVPPTVTGKPSGVAG